jgi:hypothetical protein
MNQMTKKSTKPAMRTLPCLPAYEITLADAERHAHRVELTIIEETGGRYFVASLPSDLAAMDGLNLWNTTPGPDETEADFYDRVKAFRIARWMVATVNNGWCEDCDLLVEAPGGTFDPSRAEAEFRARLLKELQGTLMREGCFRVIAMGGTAEEYRTEFLAA